MTKQKTVKENKVHRKINKKNLAAGIISVIVACMILVGTGGLLVMFSMLNDKPEVTTEAFESNESSQIYDMEGNLIGSVGNQIRSNITYNDLPQSLVDALVSVEDSRFFEHNGFDVSRFSKAILENIKSFSFSQGGSTITMQLIKNTYFVDDEAGISAGKKVGRKVQEIFMSFEVNKLLSKERVIELYLNKLNFGGAGNIRGVQTAAQYYFGKDVQELSLAESAMLVGIVNSPTYYNPFKYLDKATKRRNTVLNLMQYHGYITKEECELAKAIKVEDLLIDQTKISSGSGTQYQAYIDTVVQEVKDTTGLDPYSTPMKIYTYMNPKVQQTIDDIQSGNVNDYFEYPDELMEIAIVSMNNSTGEINGIGGGRNYSSNGSLLLNHATDQYKQPGSSVKPFLSYALAFEVLGWSTSHVLTDRPIVYKGTTKVIKNYSGNYSGDVTMLDAVGNSLNTPAIQTLQEVVDNVGSKYVIQYLQNLGFSKVTNELFDIGYAIGGSTFEVSAVELAAAHATMINEGLYVKPHTISKIEFLDGTDPIEPSYSPTQVLSKESAYLVTQLMYNNVYGPYSNYMQILKRDYPVYAKTGTSDWGDSGKDYGIPTGAAKDLWMVSSTSDYTISVWTGYEKAVKDKETYFTTAKSRLNIRGKISKLLLDANESTTKPSGVTKPDGVVSITHILGTYPYASVIDGMDSKYVTTGLIKKDFAALANPESASVESLKSFDVQLDAKGELVAKFATYPDSSKLEVAPDTKDISLSVGDKYIEATGRRIFDWTWIYGRIMYKGYVEVDGKKINDINNETDTYTTKLDLKPGQHIKVCGYYSYNNLDIKSNEVCKEFDVEDKELTVTVPSINATKTEIELWASTYNIKVTFEDVVNEAKKNTNEIISSNSPINGVVLSIKQSEIAKLDLTVKLYKGLVCGSNASIVNGACTCNQNYEGDPLKGCTLTQTPPPSVDPVPPTALPNA